ncbi:hypothetical protein D047_4453, partial [Vibrio parahaemolyticus VPTS-2010_2]
QTAE